jgi:hypothetical protein
MGKSPSAVAEIVALVPKSRRSQPWWERVSPEVAEALPGILDAYHDGQFGPHDKPASQGIAAWLQQHGVEVGFQGVLTWLKRHARS